MNRQDEIDRLKADLAKLREKIAAYEAQETPSLAEQLRTLQADAADLDSERCRWKELAEKAGEVVTAAENIVALWRSQKVSGLSRQERNEAIEGERAALISAVEHHAGLFASQPVPAR